MISISNTGKTLTIGGHDDEFRNVIKSRVKISFYPAARRYRLTPNARGYTITEAQYAGRSYITIPPGRVSDKMPSFVRVRVTMRAEGGHFWIDLPKELPPARPHNRKNDIDDDPLDSPVWPEMLNINHAAIDEIISAQQPRANILIEVAGQSLPFRLPESELLALALSWSHAGYAIK